MEKVDYDLVIIGGGPAGLTAGIYAARARLNVLLVEKVVPGGQILITDWIENYPGFPEGISGPDLTDKMVEQAKQFDLKIESTEVLSMDLDGPVKTLKLDRGEIKTHTVIIATGASPGHCTWAKRNSTARGSPIAPPATALFSGTRWSWP